MNTQTIVTNGTISIAINLDDSKASNYRKAVEQGYTGDSTGFGRLLNGNKSMVKGFEVKIVAIEIKKPKAITVNKTSVKFNTVGALENLEIADLEIKIPAVRQTYGSLKTSKGRLQITPIKDGSFGVLFYQSKGTNVEAEINALNIEHKVGAKYTTMKRVDADTLVTLIASL